MMAAQECVDLNEEGEQWCYDVNGKLVEQLVNTHKVLGYHKISWDAREHATGLYFIKLIAGEYQNTQKVMLVK